MEISITTVHIWASSAWPSSIEIAHRTARSRPVKVCRCVSPPNQFHHSSSPRPFPLSWDRISLQCRFVRRPQLRWQTCCELQVPRTVRTQKMFCGGWNIALLWIPARWTIRQISPQVLLGRSVLIDIFGCRGDRVNTIWDKIPAFKAMC